MKPFYKPKDFKGQPVPKMRTSVVPQRPSIHSPHGQYLSKTFWYPPGFLSCSLEIHLVWFDRMGWYYIVQMESHWDVYSVNKKPCPPGRKIFEMDFGRREHDYWDGGKLLPFCAEAADTEAKSLIEARGLELPPLRPYVLKDEAHENYEAYLDGTWPKES